MRLDMTKKIFILALALALFSVANAQKFNYVYKGNEFKCKIKNGLATITAFDTKTPNITIPAKVMHKGKEYPVNSISTFINGVNYLTVNLTIEEGVKDIDDFSFNEFRKLRVLKLPSTIEHIGKNAIRDNNRLAYHIPSSIDIESIRNGIEIWASGGEIVYIESQYNVRAAEREQEEMIAQQEKAEKRAQKEQRLLAKELEEQRNEIERLKREKEEMLASNQDEVSDDEEEGGKKIGSKLLGNIKNKIGNTTNKVGGLFSNLVIGKANNNNDDDDDEDDDDKNKNNEREQQKDDKPKEKKNIEIFAKKEKVKPVDVDIDIPVTNSTKNQNTYCVIIANENYEDVPAVEYASRDGEIFKEYCIKTLGIPERQIRSFIDASYTDIKRALNWLESITSVVGGDTKVIFYYAGHGIPNEKDKSAYLIPVDGFPKDITTCFKLSDLYTRLGNLKTGNVTVFLDACFSGVKRGSEQALVAARGVAIKPKEEVLKGNMIVFTATSDDETALSYQEKRHGMFTYYLLDQLKKSKGKITLGDLYNTVSQEVKKSSMLENDKLQTPSVNVSGKLKSKWMNIQF